MRDVYTETIVAIQPKPVDIVIKYILVALIGIAAILFLIEGLLALIPLGLFSFLLFRQMSKTNAEYDYVHTNDDFDVDLVTLGNYRKSLCTVDLNQVLLIASESSPEMLPIKTLILRTMSEIVHLKVYMQWCI